MARRKGGGLLAAVAIIHRKVVKRDQACSGQGPGSKSCTKLPAKNSKLLEPASAAGAATSRFWLQASSPLCTDLAKACFTTKPRKGSYTEAMLEAEEDFLLPGEPYDCRCGAAPCWPQRTPFLLSRGHYAQPESEEDASAPAGGAFQR